jgi:hypothetical protein
MSHYCLKTIKSFGFTPKMIDQYLGEPTIVNNPHYKSAAPMKLWERDLVDQVRSRYQSELALNLAKRAKTLASREKRKSAKRSLLGFYLENYSYNLDEYSACHLVEVAFKTGAIATSVFKSFDLTINLVAGYLADEEEIRIQKEFASDESVYTKIYSQVRNALKASEFVLETIKCIHNIIEDWEREEQEQAEKQKIERLRIRLIQQSFLEYIEVNFDDFLAHAHINPNAIQEINLNSSKNKKNKQLKRNIKYVWSRIQNYARTQNPNFANTPAIQNCGQFYQQILIYVNKILQEKQGTIRG